MTRDEATAIGRRNGDEHRASLCHHAGHTLVARDHQLVCSRCGIPAYRLHASLMMLMGTVSMNPMLFIGTAIQSALIFPDGSETPYLPIEPPSTF